MGIYRGAGGSGDAINDSSSEALITIQARDQALAAQAAAEAAQAAAQLAETNAETAETNAETAETNAETAATNAANSASAASTSASNAASSASAASTSASNASTSASNASTSASNAATSATNASNSASAAATSATNASNSASAAATSATNASNSASAAATSASNAAASYDSFDDRYLGAKSSAPTLDNDGNTLLVGALYFNTTTNEMKVWSGSAWLNAYASLSGALLATNNLSDLNNTATARTNLGVAIGVNVQAWDADLDTWATKTAPSGTVVGTSDSQTLTNKTIALDSNTVSGTLAQFNTAVTDADLVSIAGTETLTNKTLTSPTINTATISGGTINGTTVGASTASSGRFTTLEATGVTTVQAGTVSSPSITFTGDTNTGIYSPAADTIGFTEGGVEGLRINSNGQTSTSIAGTASLPSFTRTGDENTGIFFPAADTIAFTEGGVEAMRITAAGDVGIGGIPSFRLDVRAAQGIVSNTSTTGTNPVDYRVSNTGGNTYFGRDNSAGNAFGAGAYSTVIWSEGAYPMVLATNGSERMRIDSSGNVGIGTSSPTNLGSTVRTLELTAGSSAGGGGYYLSSNGTTTTQLGTDGVAGYIGTRSNHPAVFTTNNTERMRITSGGDVLIGTTSQFGSSKVTIQTGGGAVDALALYSPSTTNGAVLRLADNNFNCAVRSAPAGGTTNLAFDVAGSERMRIDSSGNVGIGTNSPASRLEVSGSSNQRNFIRSTSANAESAFQFQNATTGTASNDGFFVGLGGDQVAYFIHYENQPIQFATNGTDRMRVLSTGNILAFTGANFSATGTGIAFPATQSASSDANTLDDYEEGTYTVTLTAGISGTITLNSGINTLKYTKVGRLVTIQGRFSISSISSPTGQVRMSLPFANASGGAGQSDYASFSVFTHDVDLVAGTIMTFAESNGGDTTTAIFQTLDNAAWSALSAASLKGNGNEYFYIVGSYFTT